MRMDEKNKNTKWQQAEVLKLNQLDEYSTFDDQGKMVKFLLVTRNLSTYGL